MQNTYSSPVSHFSKCYIKYQRNKTHLDIQTRRCKALFITQWQYSFAPCTQILASGSELYRLSYGQDKRKQVSSAGRAPQSPVCMCWMPSETGTPYVANWCLCIVPPLVRHFWRKRGLVVLRGQVVLGVELGPHSFTPFLYISLSLAWEKCFWLCLQIMFERVWVRWKGNEKSGVKKPQ